MAEQKTKPTEISVESFIDKLENELVRDDCHELVRIMRKVTKLEPVLWSGNIVGFGKYHYKYDSGHEGFSCIAAFSPRKQNITVYLMPDFADIHADLLENLGKFKTAKCCLYIKKLKDIDVSILEVLIKHSVEYVRKNYPD